MIGIHAERPSEFHCEGGTGCQDGPHLTFYNEQTCICILADLQAGNYGVQGGHLHITRGGRDIREDWNFLDNLSRKFVVKNV